jgi:hypothetical protein
MNNGYPWFRFYPADWLAEQNLLLCSYAGRGLWIELLALMYTTDEQGFLARRGRPMTAGEGVRLRGGTVEEVEDLLKELEDNGVLSRTDKGVIYSRRMVRDLQRRAKESDKKRHQRDDSPGFVPPHVPKDVPGHVPAPVPPRVREQEDRQKSERGRLPPADTKTPDAPPSLEVVLAYGRENGVTQDDARQFFDENTAAGWLDKHGRPIRDWRASLRRWRDSPIGQKKNGALVTFDRETDPAVKDYARQAADLLAAGENDNLERLYWKVSSNCGEKGLARVKRHARELVKQRKTS